MPFTPFRAGGVSGFVCTRGAKKPRCSAKGCSGPGFYLCDEPIGSGKTCSAAMCGHHRTRAGAIDLCPKHARQDLALFPVAGAPRTVPLSLYCECKAIAPLPCDGRDEAGKRCTTVVCSRHGRRAGRRWLCLPCAAALASPPPPPPQLQLLGVSR
jgi:hypothetical protein